MCSQQKKLHLNLEKIKKLLAGCRLNQRAAQKELYHTYYAYAMSIALCYSANYDHTAEMINHAFLKIFKDIKNLEPGYENTVASFTIWFERVMLCACKDYIKKYNKNHAMVC